MAHRNYDQEEKISYLEEFNNSGQSIRTFASANNIPESTFRDWINEDRNMAFGKIHIDQSNVVTAVTKTNKNTIVFASESIRIELKENFSKDFLTKIVEVLINA